MRHEIGLMIAMVNRWLMGLSLWQQRGVCLAALSAVLILTFYLLVIPSRAYHYSAQSSLVAEQSLLLWMREKSSLAKTLANHQRTSSPKDPHSEPLISMITESTETDKLTISRFEPSHDGKLVVWLNDAEFSNLILWLDHLESKEVISTHRVSVSRGTTDGLVNVQIIFKKNDELKLSQQR